MSEITIDQLPASLQAIIAEYQANSGTRSPVRQQLKDLRTPRSTNPKARLHRPTFFSSAEEDGSEGVYEHQVFPKLMFHASKGEVTVIDQDALKALGDGWQDTPIVAENVTAFDAVRAQLDELSEEDRAYFFKFQKEQKMKRLQALTEGLNGAELDALTTSTPDTPVKRGPGRPKASVHSA